MAARGGVTQEEVVRIAWRLLLLGSCGMYGYYAVKFIGAWLEVNPAPQPSALWSALAFSCGALVSLQEVLHD